MPGVTRATAFIIVIIEASILLSVVVAAISVALYSVVHNLRLSFSRFFSSC